MDHNYLQFTMSDMSSDLVTDGFARPDQQHIVSQISNISELPKVTKNDPLYAINKDHIYGLQLERFGCTPSNSCPILPESTLVVSEEVAESVQWKEFENNVHVQNRIVQSGEFEGELVIRDPLEAFLAGSEDIQTINRGGIEVVNDNVVATYDEEVDPGVEDALQFIQSQEEDDSVEFIAIESEKKRNPPYLMNKEGTKITTKNDEPIRFRLRGASVCQVVMVSLKYTEEKYKNNPVTACRLHSRDDLNFNFELSPVEETEMKYEKIGEHPTVHFTLKAKSLDFLGDFHFHTTFRCLNSCHKGNGKKMEIIFKLMDPATNVLVKENRFEVRACKNVKRDYKEAFQEEGTPAEKRVRPESFLSQEEPQVDQTICSKKETKPVKAKKDPVSVVMLKPGEQQEIPENKVVDCVCTPVARTPQPEYHIVKLPTLEMQRTTFDMIRLLGGEIMKLDSVYPVEGSDNVEQEDSAP